MAANTTETIDGIIYTVYIDHATVSGCTSDMGTDITILSTVNNVPVTSIGGNVFKDNKTLKNVTLPDTITSIEGSAFQNATALESISLSEGLTTIGRNAFSNTTSLTQIMLPESLTSIDWWGFSGSGLTSVVIPKNVTSLGQHIFENCPSLTTVEIEEGVTSTFDSVFNDNKSLTTVILPDSLKTIGSQTFRNCTALTSINIPEGVERIGKWAFSNTALKSVEIPDSVTGKLDSVFQDCSSLTSVKIGVGVEELSGTFNSCIELREIEIPENITYIGHGAFNNCQSLLKVTILNQNVTIKNDITYNDKTTFNNGLDETGSSFFAGTIYGYNNSTAQAFAERNSYKFESLGDPPRDLGDVNGDKAPNSMGYDLFRFLYCFTDSDRKGWFDNKNTFFGTYGSGLTATGTTRDDLIAKCKENKMWCTRLLQHDQWEFKGDYPNRF